MNLLALDTSTLACSVALQAGDEVTERYEVKPREHTRLLLPMIRGVLADADLQPGDLDAIVLGNGPGSFIGLRIAASVAQGMCFAAGIGLVPVSSLAAVAVPALRDHDRVLVAQDAHMHEVYLAGFVAGEDGVPVETRSVSLQAAGPIDGLAGSWCAAGAGWSRYPELLAQNAERVASRAAADYPHARDLLTLGIPAWRAGRAIDAALLEPAYVREEVAQPGSS